jgi:hypothetical protein
LNEDIDKGVANGNDVEALHESTPVTLWKSLIWTRQGECSTVIRPAVRFAEPKESQSGVN